MEICLFHVSVALFRTTKCTIEPAETQETARRLMFVSYIHYATSSISETCYFKFIFHLRKLFLLLETFFSLAS